MDASLVYLTQTDTTVGFLSSNNKKLSKVKKRDLKQKNLQVVDSFKTLGKFVRVPKKHRKFVRNSEKTTFVYCDSEAYRVPSQNSEHRIFLKKFHHLYSTSANSTGENFNLDFALDNSDIIIYNKDKFSQKSPSKIYKLFKAKRTKIR